jgi:hypothetical protein
LVHDHFHTPLRAGFDFLIEFLIKGKTNLCNVMTKSAALLSLAKHFVAISKSRVVIPNKWEKS